MKNNRLVSSEDVYSPFLNRERIDEVDLIAIAMDRETYIVRAEVSVGCIRLWTRDAGELAEWRIGDTRVAMDFVRRLVPFLNFQYYYLWEKGVQVNYLDNFCPYSVEKYVEHCPF